MTNKIIVTKHAEFRRPGTPLTFSVVPRDAPQLLPHDVRDYVLSIGAGHPVDEEEPGEKDDDKKESTTSKRPRKTE